MAIQSEEGDTTAGINGTDIVIMSRKEAKQRGLKFYYTNKLCKHGHRDWRFTSTAWCRACARAVPPERIAMYNARARCYNMKNGAYKHYGARGIAIASGWRQKDGWLALVADIGPRPGPDFSLDRINPDGPYTPTNCCWRTKKLQAANRRNTVWVTLDERRICLASACKWIGISETTVRNRAKALAAAQGVDYTNNKGRFLHAAIEHYRCVGRSDPVSRAKRYNVAGRRLTAREAATFLGVTLPAIYSRASRNNGDVQKAIDYYVRRNTE